MTAPAPAGGGLDRVAMRGDRGLGVGIFLTSFALLLLELVLTRIYSVIFGYHFAFLAISIAMFGLGVAGIAVYVRPGWFPEAGLRVQLAWAATLCGASTYVVASVLIGVPLSPASVAALAVTYALSALPFCFGGVCLALAFARRAAWISRLYYYDLAGAALGSLAAIALLDWLGGPNAVFVTGAVAVAAAFCFGASSEPAPTDAARVAALRRFGMAAAALGAAGFAASFAFRPVVLAYGRRAYDALAARGPLANSFEWYLEQYVGGEIDAVVRFARIVLAAGFGLGLVATVAASRAQRFELARGRWHLWPPIWCGAFMAAFLGAQLATSAVKIRFADGSFEAVSLFERWNSISRIKVFPQQGWGRSRILAWGLSKRWDGADVDQLHLKIDSSAGTPVLRFDGDLGSPQAQHLRDDVSSLGFHLVPDARVLIVGTGGGRDILTSLVFGARRVVGVELNPLVLRAVNDALGEYTGHLDRRSEVEYVAAEGRSFLRRSRDEYDVIQIALIDTWASVARGALSLSENTLYTQEAFEDYYGHLSPRGVLSITRWWQDPPWLTYRLLHMAIDGLRAVGEDPVRNLLVVRGPERGVGQGRVVNVVVKRTALEPDEIRRVSELCAELGFDLLYAPGASGGEESIRFFVTANPDERARFAAAAAEVVTPATDDRPFFFSTTRAHELFVAGGGPIALRILARLLYLIPALVIAFMLGPLVLLRGNELAALGSRGVGWIAYFGSLGLGFIVIEIVLIQRLILFLGHPIYAVTLVVSGMLLSSSLGSLASGRLPPERLDRGLGGVVGALVAALLALHFALPPVLEAGFQLPLTARLALGGAVVGALGFLMGMPFPLGVRAITRESPGVVPWMWGVNGACSVLGTVMAACASMYAGFRVTYLLGASFYLLAAALAGAGVLGSRTSASVQP